MDATERRNRASMEATEWWLRLRAADIPRHTREQYIDWIRESPVHLAEMLRVAQVHNALELFNRWGNISTDPDGDDSAGDNIVSLRPQQEKRSRSAHFRIWAVAASVVMVLGAAGLQWI